MNRRSLPLMLLAASMLAGSAFAHDPSASPKASSPAQDPKAPAGPDSESPSKDASPDAEGTAKFYLKLSHGGEVMFKGDDSAAKHADSPEEAKAPAGAPAAGANKAKAPKIKYKGYSKKNLAAYKDLAKAKMEPGAAESLGEAMSAKAADLAAESAFVDDTEATIKQRMDTLKTGPMAQELEKSQMSDIKVEYQKLEAAQAMVPEMRKSVAKKMKALERTGGGKRMFKDSNEPGGAAGKN